MAISKVADRGSVALEGQTTSVPVDMAAAGAITVGNFLIARVAGDNSGGGGAARTLTIPSDPRGNTWVIKTPSNVDPGAASAGSTCWIAYAPVANAYTNGDDITLTFSGNIGAVACVIEEWSGIDTATPEVTVPTNRTQANATTLTTPISGTPTASGQLFYCALSVEGPGGDGYTQDSDTTDGSWVTPTSTGTSNATPDLNQTVRGGYKLVTGTSAQSWTPTLGTARDMAATAVVFAVGPTIKALEGRAQEADASRATPTRLPGLAGRAQEADNSRVPAMLRTRGLAGRADEADAMRAPVLARSRPFDTLAPEADNARATPTRTPGLVGRADEADASRGDLTVEGGAGGVELDGYAAESSGMTVAKVSV